MTNDHHESENLADLFDSVFSGRVLEKRNKNVFQPISVQSLFFIENLENCQNACVSKFSESSLHKLEKFLFHLITKDLIRFLVICEENKLKITWIKFIQILFDFGIHFFPEFFILTVKFFHQMIELHYLSSFYFLKVFINVIKCLIDPWVLVPIVLLLAFDLR